MKEKIMKEKTRIGYLDVARSIAIISITFNHAVNRSFNMNHDTYIEFSSVSIFLTIAKVLLYAFSRIGVPLFIMITGSLLLTRDYIEDGKIKKFIKHNWLSLFITTEIWLFIMFWYKQVLPGSILLNDGLSKCIAKFVTTMLFINPFTMGSMWYMEMILCVYFMIPILAVALKNFSYKYFCFPCAIVLICSYVFPVLNGILTGMGITNELFFTLESTNVFSIYVVYLLFGYYIHTGLFSKINKKWILICLVVSIFMFCSLNIWMWSTKSDFLFGTNYKDIFIFLASVCIFELMHRSKNHLKYLTKFTRFLAEISFGIYFVHICIMEGLNAILKHYCPHIQYLSKFIILEVTSFLGAVAIIQIVRKNRYASKYLFGIKG